MNHRRFKGLHRQYRKEFFPTSTCFCQQTHDIQDTSLKNEDESVLSIVAEAVKQVVSAQVAGQKVCQEEPSFEIAKKLDA